MSCFKCPAEYHSTLQHGRVVEEGTYAQLVSQSGPFSSLVTEFGSGESVEDENKQEVAPIQTVRLSKKHMGKAAGTGRLEVGYTTSVITNVRVASCNRRSARLVLSGARSTRSISEPVERNIPDR